MPGLPPEIIAEINNTTLETYLNRGTVFKQNIQNKPLLKAFDASAGKFPGGKEKVSFAVSAGQGGGRLRGYTGDDQVTYYNPVGVKRASFPWKEHHIGTVLTMTELKIDGIDVDESGASQTTSAMSDREMQALANRLDEKNEMLGEDYAKSLDELLHGDGSSDTKALAGIQSLILDNPAIGRVDRGLCPRWRAGSDYGQPGQWRRAHRVLEKEVRQLKRYASGSSRWKWFAGSDFIDGYQKELRANGYYSQTGFMGDVDGGMSDPKFKRMPIEYDPTLDDLGLSKRCYVIDMGQRGVRLLYMDGQRMKRHHPARPFDRYVMYNGITTTAVLVARQLNTSAVYDIA
jgi:hypothetical protein